MQTIQELIEGGTVLRFKKKYLSYSCGTKIIVLKEIAEKNPEENVAIFRIKGTFSTNTIRTDLFWEYLGVQ